MPTLARAAAAMLAVAALAACGQAPERGAPPPPTAAPTPRVPLAVGVKLAVVPNLPGVPFDDVPEAARREVEVLALDHGGMRISWSGVVRMERPESARRREDWVRARANAPPGATPLPQLAAEYEDHEVGGSLLLPEFGSGSELLLPGLWPEGQVTLRATSGVWLSSGSYRELSRAGQTRVPFFLGSKLLKDPAASLLSRAGQLSAQGDGWTAIAPPRAYAVRLDGRETALPTLAARNWFGTFEVLADAANPLVLSLLPDPPSSRLLDLFAPANVLKTLLGYRVSEIETPKARRT